MTRLEELKNRSNSNQQISLPQNTKSRLDSLKDSLAPSNSSVPTSNNTPTNKLTVPTFKTLEEAQAYAKANNLNTINNTVPTTQLTTPKTKVLTPTARSLLDPAYEKENPAYYKNREADIQAIKNMPKDIANFYRRFG